jgi:cation diffusion facilitator family transporter
MKKSIQNQSLNIEITLTIMSIIMVKPKRPWLVPDYGDPEDPNIRAKYGYLEGIVSIIGNSFLFVIKLVLGLFINSIALIADAFHTLSDSGTSAVVILGFKMTKKPPDKEHPFGHGRVEYIATLIVAILLILIGLGFIQQSIERFLDTVGISNTEFAMVIGIVIIISAAVKEFMAQFSYQIGKWIKSDILIADGWHHRSDAIASVAVGLGIIGSTYGYPYLDPMFGVIVSLIIIYVGIDIIRKTSDILIGYAPDEDIVNKIKKIVNSIEGVFDVDSISVHDYGVTKVVSIQVKVENDLKLDEAHHIADSIENKIRDILNFSTIIHLEPQETHQDTEMSKRIIERILEKQKEIRSFHKIQIVRIGNSENIKMHIIVDKYMSVSASHKLYHNLESVIEEKYGECKVDIHLEPCEDDCKVCTFSCKNRKLA